MTDVKKDRTDCHVIQWVRRATCVPVIRPVAIKISEIGLFVPGSEGHTISFLTEVMKNDNLQVRWKSALEF